MHLFSIVVVLGQRLCANGSLPHSLEQRVRVGASLAASLSVPLLLSGGHTQPDLPLAEAQAMRAFAQSSCGAVDCLLEDRALNTIENALFSLPFIGAHKEVHLVTSDFHLPRAELVFRRVLGAGTRLIGHEAHSGADELALAREARSMAAIEESLRRYGIA